MASVPTTTLPALYSPAFQAEVERDGGYFADQSGDRLARLVSKNSPDKLETLLRYDQYERFPYYILRRVDHLSMAHAVEARIPFLQPSIVRFAHALPASLKVVGETVKTPIAHAAREWIPESIVNRPKQPFTLPITAMIKRGQALHEMIGDVLMAPDYRCRELFRQDMIKDLFQQQTENPSAHAAGALWSLLMLEMWLATRDINL